MKRLSPASSAPLKVLGEVSLPLPLVTYGEYHCDYYTVLAWRWCTVKRRNSSIDSTVNS
jgi:hypothetical protein